MRKWDSEIFGNNHIRLMKCHIGMATFYCCLFGVLALIASGTDSTGSFASAIAFLSLPVLLHLALAYGSFRRIEISRKVSEIVFALFLLAFPIGTFLSMFLFLPATTWKAPDDAKP
jgi:hypothetical protein